jgi:hypothetical protein
MSTGLPKFMPYEGDVSEVFVLYGLILKLFTGRSEDDEEGSDVWLKVQWYWSVDEMIDQKIRQLWVPSSSAYIQVNCLLVILSHMASLNGSRATATTLSQLSASTVSM